MITSTITVADTVSTTVLFIDSTTITIAMDMRTVIKCTRRGHQIRVLCSRKEVLEALLFDDTGVCQSAMCILVRPKGTN